MGRDAGDAGEGEGVRALDRWRDQHSGLPADRAALRPAKRERGGPTEIGHSQAAAAPFKVSMPIVWLEVAKAAVDGQRAATQGQGRSGS